MTRRPRILLLHPPGDGHRLYQLDGYCSQPQKGPFRWHPLEFVALGAAWRDQAELTVMDLGPRHDDGAALPTADLVVALAGAYGWHHQAGWLETLLRRGVRLVLSGDLPRHEPARVFARLPGLHGILPELAAPPAVDAALAGDGLWQAGDDGWQIPTVPHGFRLGAQDFSRWDHRLYRLPFTARRPFASVFSQVGCPHTCSYCMLQHYTAAFRDPDDFAAECRALRDAGARHLYVRDATLNSSPRHLDRVLPILQQTGLPWNAFARLDGISEHAPALRAAGCTVLQFGLDAVDPAGLGRWGKAWRGSSVEAEIRTVREHGIVAVGHFVAGLENGVSPAAIADHAHRIGLDWATITPLMHRPGTDLWARRPEEDPEAGLEPPATLEQAVRAATRRFYLHPARLLRTGRRFAGEPMLGLRAACSLWARPPADSPSAGGTLE